MVIVPTMAIVPTIAIIKEDMLHQTMSAEEGNHLYQRKLATALVASLGFDTALETCLSNDWEGVLGVLLTDRPATRT